MKGFTLIEVIISVTISLLLMGAIIANYNSYNDNQSLKQAALTLKNSLRFAQGKALSGEKPQLGCTTLVGWDITFAASSYVLRANCTPEGETGDVTTTTLPGTISLTAPLPPTITFNVLNKGTSLAATQTIKLTGRSKKYVIEVTPSGDINDVGFE